MMPGFDGTGPRGEGPMTGGGRGYCALPVNQTYQRPLGTRLWQGLRTLNPLQWGAGTPGAFSPGAGLRRGGGRGGMGRGRGGFGRGRGGW